MINRILSSLFATLLVLAPLAGNSRTKAEIDRLVAQRLAKMSLEEKVGQMAELTIEALADYPEGKFTFNEKKVNDAFEVYKIGSLLNPPYTVAQTPAEWQTVVTRMQNLAMEKIGIPLVYGTDQNHGASYTNCATFFPQNINVGASFNPELAEEAARIAAYETRACNIPWTYSPTVDMARDPRWPRVWENYGEDPLVNAIMGAAQVRGFQGPDRDNIDANHIGVSAKHYLGYSMARTGKDRTPAYITESDLREKCFAPFKACIEAGALTIMANSGSINGVPVHSSYRWLTQWTKEELNWDGMIVTDWADINNLYTREHVAADKKEAIALAINAGVDMAMEPYNVDFCTLLIELVKEGRVPMSRIDDAVTRILRFKYRLGLFDRPNTLEKDYPKFASKEFAEKSLRAAEESEILLKNKNNILPLAKGTKILVTGPNANQMRCLNGGWSYTWQGHLADRYAGKYNTIYEAMCNTFGKENIVLEQGVTYVPEGSYFEENLPEIEKAVAAAQNVDVILACVGENSYCETPGNLDDLALSVNQRNLVKALAATGKPIVLILNEGRPRIISDIEPLADAVINVLLPSNYGADALANILIGKVNPSGKMPYTYPRYQASLTTYDYRVSEQSETMGGLYDYNAEVSVQWPFGFGLSYTSFEYSNIKVNRTSFTADDNLTVSIDVTNTGKRAGKEVVMLYSRDMVASLVPENRRLRAFKKIDLAPGETRTVELTIKGSDLAFVGYDGRWILEKGDFRLQVGNQAVMVNCTATAKM